MSLSEDSTTRIVDTLQSLFDEGWDAGVAYGEIVNGPESVIDQYWNDAEIRENKLMWDALNYIYHEITGENLSEDTSDTGDGTVSEDTRGVGL